MSSWIGKLEKTSPWLSAAVWSLSEWMPSTESRASMNAAARALPSGASGNVMNDPSGIGPPPMLSSNDGFCIVSYGACCWLEQLLAGSRYT